MVVALSSRDARRDASVSRANWYPKSIRVRKRGEYRRVFAQGVKVVTPILVFFVIPNQGPSARLGLAVSRKVGKAVVRNRIKRRIREAFRHHRAELPHVDIVAIARRGASAHASPAYVDCLMMLTRRLAKRGLNQGRDQ